MQGTVLAYDQVTGFGLIQALNRVDVPTLPLGDSDGTRVGDPVVIAGAGGRKHSLAARIVAKQEYVGYWEYLVDEAIFTAPAHPNWGGTAMIGAGGELLGIGSLQLQQAAEDGQAENLNMIVPIDLLKPILNDLLTTGRTKQPARPWLGIYATESDGDVVIVGMATKGPAQRANLKAGDAGTDAACEDLYGKLIFWSQLALKSLQAWRRERKGFHSCLLLLIKKANDEIGFVQIHTNVAHSQPPDDLVMANREADEKDLARCNSILLFGLGCPIC